MTDREFTALVVWLVEQAPEPERMGALLFRILHRLFGEKEGASAPEIVYNQEEQNREGERT